MPPDHAPGDNVSGETTIRIGVDIGGTFTDLQILDEASGTSHSLKTPTTPDDPSIGLMTGIAEASRRFGFRLDQIGFLLHGTTIATNAVLERRLPRGALITTAGFEDVLDHGELLARVGHHGKAQADGPVRDRGQLFFFASGHCQPPFRLE